MKIIARSYAVIVIILALWAWYTDIKLLHSPREHLLPDILLSAASMPTSLTLDPLYDLWPNLFNTPFVQLAWLTICASVQVGAVFMLSNFMLKGRSNA